MSFRHRFCLLGTVTNYDDRFFSQLLFFKGFRLIYDSNFLFFHLVDRFLFWFLFSENFETANSL